MSRTMLTCAAGALLLCLGPTPTVAETTPGIGVELSLSPSEEHAEAYECAAVIRDVASGEVLSAPTIVFLRGEEATAESGLPDARKVRFTVFVADDGSVARYSAEVVDGERVVVAQRATIEL